MKIKLLETFAGRFLRILKVSPLKEGKSITGNLSYRERKVHGAKGASLLLNEKKEKRMTTHKKS